MPNLIANPLHNAEAVTISQPQLLYATESCYNDGWHSSLHTHYCAELFYITDGAGYFQIEDKHYPVKAHDLIIINPNVLHTEMSDNINPLHYIVIGIEGIALASSSKEYNVQFHISNFKKKRNVLWFYFSQIFEESTSKSPNSEILYNNLVENLIIILGREVNLTLSLDSSHKKSSRLCITIKQFIDNHYKENLTLEMLADLTHISKYHMVHIFTQEYGISPINYMIEKRIEEGKHLLSTTDYSLSLIGRTLGFSSPSYFSQAFKKHTQYSPIEYRKKHHYNHS